MTATNGLLDGVRIVEVSMLGPAAITTALADLGAEVIKVETPAGDYVRQMTWPIVEGVSLMHLHVNRGKHSVVIDLRTEEGVALFLDLVRESDVVVEAMRPGGLAPARPHLRAHAGGQPAHRPVHDLGLRRHRPVPEPRQPRHRLRRVGRDLRARGRRQRPPGHPRPRLDRHQRGAAVRCAGHPRRDHPGPRDRSGRRARARAVRCRGRVRLVPQRDLPRLRAPRVRGHRQQVRRLRAPRAGDRGHARRGPLPGLRVLRRQRPVHGERAALLEEVHRGGRPARAVRALARLAVRRPRQRATPRCRPSSPRSSAAGRPRSGWTSGSRPTSRSPR